MGSLEPKNIGAANRKHARHKGETVVNADGRTCNGCGEFKAWDEYYACGDSYTGHRATCKSCKKAKMRANSKRYYQKRREENPPRPRAGIDEGFNTARANAFLRGRL